jgi:hypothetical protein
MSFAMTAAEQRGDDGEDEVARLQQQRSAEQGTGLPASAEEDGTGGTGDFENGDASTFARCGRSLIRLRFER